MHSTNYYNTFIEVADDCPVDTAEIPPQKAAAKTAANMQYEMIAKNPYKFSSDDVIFGVFAEKNELTNKELDKGRENFFSKGQPCMRSSPLTKRYGWGVHNDTKGKIAIYSVESADYKKFSKDKSLEHVKAMRSKRG